MIRIKQKVNSSTQKFEFENLNAGPYSAKLIDDENENMQWDNGNFFLHQQPETIFYFKQKITVRENWDVDVVMKTDE